MRGSIRACVLIAARDAAASAEWFFQALAISAKFQWRDFNLDQDRRTLPDGSQLSSLSNAQPHLIITRKRGRHEYLECIVMMFSDDGDVFGPHDTPHYRLSDRYGRDVFESVTSTADVDTPTL